jgi:lipoprotein-anchoring transpeptidase ErfK/SrfK
MVSTADQRRPVDTKGGIVMSPFDHKIALFGIAAVAALVCSSHANKAAAEALALAGPRYPGTTIFKPVMRDRPSVQRDIEEDAQDVTDPRWHRRVVDLPTGEAHGTVIIDTPNTYLYFVLGGGRAIRYGIGVGREGFTWSGVQTVTRKAEWPDWVPPAEMVARQPYLPRFMAGGSGNPLGARAMYLGGTIYRIHGTNQPSTIGGRVSSGCIRMVNEDVIDLYGRVDVGTKVVVLPADSHRVRDQGGQIIRSLSPPISLDANRVRAAALH